jgi:integrase
MLTDPHCKNAVCPPDKTRLRLTDSGGLYLEVTANGSKRWFWKFRLDGKEKRLALGRYPEVSLKDARTARDVARLSQRAGKDPVQERAAAKALVRISNANNFAALANEWFDNKAEGWSNHHKIRERRNLDKDLIPWLGKRPCNEITPPELLAAIRRVEARGSLDVAHRVLTTAKGVFAFAIATGRAAQNPSIHLKGALTPHKGKNFAAVTDPKKLGAVIRAIRGCRSGLIVSTALKLAPLVFQRPHELAGAEWSEIDLDAGLWTIASARMKRRVSDKLNGDPHLVPLSAQAVALLRELQPFTGEGRFVFPSTRSKSRSLSTAGLLAALASVGIDSKTQTVHGFRACARTILDEGLEFSVPIIEAQLAHSVRDANGTSYNRTSFIRQRAEMMQKWADYLDKLASGADVIPIKAA